MAEPIRWLALGYSVPVNPSKNRVYIWRKLKEYGAEYFKQGVAILPYNRQSYTKLKHLQAKILEMGGEASIVEMKFLDRRWRSFLSSRRTAHRCSSSCAAANRRSPRTRASRSSG